MGQENVLTYKTPRRPKVVPSDSKMALRGPKMTQEAYKRVPRDPKRPKRPPRWPKKVLRGPKMTQDGLQEAPRGLLETILIDLGKENDAKLAPKSDPKSTLTECPALSEKNQLNASQLGFS